MLGEWVFRANHNGSKVSANISGELRHKMKCKDRSIFFSSQTPESWIVHHSIRNNLFQRIRAIPVSWVENWETRYSHYNMKDFWHFVSEDFLKHIPVPGRCKKYWKWVWKAQKWGNIETIAPQARPKIGYNLAPNGDRAVGSETPPCYRQIWEDPRRGILAQDSLFLGILACFLG